MQQPSRSRLKRTDLIQPSHLLICKFLLVNLQFEVSWFLRLCSQQKRSPHHLRLALSILLQDWLDGLWVDRRDGSWHNTAISKPHMAARHLGRCQSMGQRKHGVSEKLYNKEGKRWAADAFKYHHPLELESSGGKTCQKYKYVTELFGDLKGLSSQVTCILHSQISRTSSKAFSWFYTDEVNEMQSCVEFPTVCVLPAPVWPYARMVPLYPSMTDLTTSWDQRHVNKTSKSPKDLGTHTEAQISKICSWLPLDRTSPWLRWEPAVGKCQMTVIGNVRCQIEQPEHFHPQPCPAWSARSPAGCSPSDTTSPRTCGSLSRQIG